MSNRLRNASARDAASQRSAQCSRLGTWSSETATVTGEADAVSAALSCGWAVEAACTACVTSAGSSVIGPSSPCTTCACTWSSAPANASTNSGSATVWFATAASTVGSSRRRPGWRSRSPRPPGSPSTGAPSTRTAPRGRRDAPGPDRARWLAATTTRRRRSPGRARASAPRRARSGCASSFIGRKRPQVQSSLKFVAAGERNDHASRARERRCPRGEPADRAGRPAALLPGAPTFWRVRTVVGECERRFSPKICQCDQSISAGCGGRLDES